MKKYFLFSLIISLILSGTLTAAGDKENLAGMWEGKLLIQGTQLRLVFNISLTEGELKGTIDSPDQGAKGIPVSEIILSGDSIRINVPTINGFYTAAVDFESYTMKGTWSQAGMSLPLDLKKTDKIEEVKRPQSPEEPFPYKTEEVFFRNEKDNITLAGTLTIPEQGSNYPLVILVSGSGPQDRDETLMNHKPFLVIADYLTRNGIGVLRYDDRGVAKSEGNFAAATSPDFVNDALSAVEFLKNRNEYKNNKLGIIGHSEGGLIAPLASLKNKEIDFIVMLAGPALPGDEILLLQSELIARTEGADDSIIKRDRKLSTAIYSLLKSDTDSAALNEKFSVLFNDYYNSLTEEEKAKAGDFKSTLAANIKIINSPWFRYFVSYDPRPSLQKISIPILALYGEKDLQVPSGENIKALESALSSVGHKKNKVVELKGLNHLFQKAETGSPTEYGSIEETFSADALTLIVEWINNL